MTELGADASAWAERGSIRTLAGHEVFVLDVPAANDAGREPLLYLHGFPTSTFDLDPVLDALAAERRVIAVDFVGFGLSEKPDRHYTLALQADVVTELTASLGVDRLALLSHDMGDTVGGELLARHLAGEWPVEITRRVLTNGSIYIEMAQLTAGQQFLLALPDARVDAGLAPVAANLADSLVATLSPGTHLTQSDLLPHGELIVHPGAGAGAPADGAVPGSAVPGSAVLPRTIRYLEERRANERRFTGAIEAHPSPLTVVWGADDPIAVLPMTDELRAARGAHGLDTTVVVLEGIGHYPMLEAPDRFAAEVLAGLD